MLTWRGRLPRRESRSRSRRPALEILEGRRLPSVTPFSFSTGAPDGVFGTASHQAGPAGSDTPEFETADAFVLSTETQINQATFIGLVPAGTNLATDIQDVTVEVYRFFPKDSNTARTITVPSRVNSPSDVVFNTRDESRGELTLTTAVLNPSFAVSDSVFTDSGMRSPNMTDGPQNGVEVEFTVTFTTPLDLPPDRYFFVPQVQLPNTAAFPFLWLSASRPTSPGPRPAALDLQSWMRDTPLAPDWLSVLNVYDRFRASPTFATFDAAFSLAGSSFTPTLDTLSRTMAVEGSAGFALTVGGSEFTTGSTVLFNGTPLATTFIDAGHLMATVPANLLTEEGTANVSVLEAQRGVSNEQTFTVTESTPTVTASVSRGRNRFRVTISGSFSDQAAEAHRVVIDWGDATSDALDFGPGTGDPFRKGHTYARGKRGRRVTVRVRVFDDKGTASRVQTFSISPG